MTAVDVPTAIVQVLILAGASAFAAILWRVRRVPGTRGFLAVCIGVAAVSAVKIFLLLTGMPDEHWLQRVLSAAQLITVWLLVCRVCWKRRHGGDLFDRVLAAVMLIVYFPVIIIINAGFDLPRPLLITGAVIMGIALLAFFVRSRKWLRDSRAELHDIAAQAERLRGDSGHRYDVFDYEPGDESHPDAGYVDDGRSHAQQDIDNARRSGYRYIGPTLRKGAWSARRRAAEAAERGEVPPRSGIRGHHPQAPTDSHGTGPGEA